MARRNGRAGKNRADRRALGGAGTMAPRERLRFPEKWEGMKNRTSERTEPGKAVAATLPAAKLVVSEASNGDGVLPPPTEVVRRLAASDLEITPVYRARPGGLFDLFVPGTRSYATYAVCGGVLVPIRP